MRPLTQNITNEQIIDYLAAGDAVKEIYIAQVTQYHIDKRGKQGSPKIMEATTDQKQKWYESGKDELIIERKDPPKFMGVGFEIDGI